MARNTNFARRLNTLSSHCTAGSECSSRIAVVDFATFDGSDCESNRQVAKALSDAFADTGFAIVTGTKVSHALTSELRKHAFNFFSLSGEEKHAANGGFTGGYGSNPYCCNEENGAQLLGDFAKPNDIVESLTIRDGDDLEKTLNNIPIDLAKSYRHVNEGLSCLRTNLEQATELALGLQQGFFNDRCQGVTDSFRLAYYPESDTPPLEGQMRYGAHVDSFGITILSLDPQHPEGLQVQIDGDWVDVPFIADSFVLNVGAMLSRWTNGVWKASVHRVVYKHGRRLSVVSGGLRPREDTMIESITQASDESKYPPVLAADFFKERVAMHRPDYLQEKGIQGADAVSKLGDGIREYQS